MRCVSCQSGDTRVVDSRDAGDSIRRRRECNECGERFTTFERIELRVLWVVKKDGRREPFSPDKVAHGIALACRKRPVDAAAQEAAVRMVENELLGSYRAELPTSAVGEAVMDVLRELDAVAYVRFASVYREFESVEHFIELIRPLREGR